MTEASGKRPGRGFLLGALLICGLIAALIAFAQATGADKAGHGEPDPTALSSVTRSPAEQVDALPGR